MSTTAIAFSPLPDAGLHAKALPIPLALHLNVDPFVRMSLVHASPLVALRLIETLGFLGGEIVG